VNYCSWLAEIVISDFYTRNAGEMICILVGNDKIRHEAIILGSRFSLLYLVFEIISRAYY